jgi:hypothetical protein
VTLRAGLSPVGGSAPVNVIATPLVGFEIPLSGIHLPLVVDVTLLPLNTVNHSHIFFLELAVFKRLGPIPLKGLRIFRDILNGFSVNGLLPGGVDFVMTLLA